MNFIYQWLSRACNSSGNEQNKYKIPRILLSIFYLLKSSHAGWLAGSLDAYIN